MTERRTIEEQGSGLATLLRAALPTVPGVNQLPGVRKTGRELPDLVLRREAVRIDPAHVHRYAELCGFARRDQLPLTYLHMVAFPLHMAMMSDTSFPFPAIGTVHLENSIQRAAHVDLDAVVDVELRAENLRKHAKGRAFDMAAVVTINDEVVWRSTSTYLRLGGGDKEGGERGTDFGAPVDGAAQWRLPANLGRRYAAVSGDSNPIHLHSLTAKAFGFRRHIAHGMWTKARAVAGIENRLAEKVDVAVAFKRPVFLPGTVRYGFREEGERIRFAVTDARGGAPHLLGVATQR